GEEERKAMAELEAKKAQEALKA
uniref:Conantokin-Oc n=1 Tax=Conus ochroleucus TaxID=72282 RepID=CKO_CONOH|nr:RecName: Full=Conantokin-Oc; Short=Con-Oc [Conus ochroleucus]